MKQPMTDRKAEWLQVAFVVFELTKRELKRKYVRSSLGMLWSVLHPLLYMLVMTLIFSSMFRRSIENYPVYYLTGYLVWALFSQSTTQMITVLTDNRDLLMTVRVPRHVFLLSRCFTALINFLLSLIPYVLLLMLYRIPFSPAAAAMLPGILFCLLFSLGIGYLLAILYVFFADIQYLYSVILTLWMYLSAIFYPIGGVPAGVQALIRNNPVYNYIAFFRDVLLYGQIPEIDLWIRAIGWGIGMFFVGFLVFHRKENDAMLLL